MATRKKRKASVVFGVALLLAAILTAVYFGFDRLVWHDQHADYAEVFIACVLGYWWGTEDERNPL